MAEIENSKDLISVHTLILLMLQEIILSTVSSCRKDLII